MAERLGEELGIDVTLIRGHGGIFEVAVNDQVVARKTLMGFPGEDEVVHAVREALG